jgi:hypothetical protein
MGLFSFWVSLRLIGGCLQELEDNEGGNWVGKTWIKRGELRGFCGQFAGCYRPMVRGLNFLLAEVRQIH